MKTKSSNIPKLINLYKFKLSMNQIFDVSTPNLQKKYIYLGINQFKNDYLRKIQIDNPHLKSFLRLNIEDE